MGGLRRLRDRVRTGRWLAAHAAAARRVVEGCRLRSRDRLHGDARRPRRVHDQARPRHQGHGQPAAGPRRSDGPARLAAAYRAGCLGVAVRVRLGPLTAPAPRPRTAAIALAGVFFSLGFVGASWISRIPQMQDTLDLSNRALGLALLGLPLGSVAVTLVLPRVLERHARRIIVIGLPAAAASL